MEWPDHFPEDCPPSDAIPPDTTVYYLVSANPPNPHPADFLSAAERNVYKNGEPCLRASLSCGLTFEYISSLLDNVPALRGKLVSEAALTGTHGVIKKTRGPGHYSLWLNKGSIGKAHNLFTVVE